jgi:hypothetical protein
LLKPGHKIRVRNGAEAEVLSETEDGEWVKVRYLVDEVSSLTKAEDLVNESDVEALLGVTRNKTWGDKVTVVLHRIPESEEYEGGYETETMTVSRIMSRSLAATVTQRRLRLTTFWISSRRSGSWREQ